MAKPPPVTIERFLAPTDLEHAIRWWESTGKALLPAGHAWDAVRIRQDWGGRALGGPGIDGPVINAPDGGEFYVLVPAGTTAGWNLAGTACLGIGHWLWVPAPSRLRPPGEHWLRSPDTSGTLADPVALLVVLRATAAGEG